MKSADRSVRLLVVMLVAGLGVGLGACTAADVRGGEAVVRDSAGITIVENDRPVWRSGEEWVVEARPVVSIGVLDGPEEYQLDQVAGAARLSDGRIVVANSGSRQIRYYDETGRFLSATGRQGDGPGEFRSLGLVPSAAPGDSLFVFDFSARRISAFDPEGRFVRSLRVEDMTFPRGRFADGQFLSVTMRVFQAGEARPGLSRDTIALLRSDHAAGTRDTVLRTLGDEMVTVTAGQSVSVATRTFGKVTVFAVSGDRFYVGTQDDFEIHEYAQDGTLLRVIRRHWDPVPVTQAHIDADRQQQVERIAASSAMRDHFERIAANMDYPATHGAHGPMHVDRAGNLWVQERRGLPAGDRVFWSVFDRHGLFLGSVSTPAGVVVFDIGDHYLLGRWRDDLDVQYVHVYRLNK